MIMMRVVGMAFLVLLALHFGALLALVGWLAATDRFNEDRVREVVELFTPTIAEAEALQEQRQAERQAERDQAERAARLEAVADGPRTLQDQLAARQRGDAVARHRLERLQRETDDLRQQIDRAKQMLSEQKQQLNEERQAFESFVRKHNQTREDEDFRQTVQMYEQLRPAQAKQMFQELLDDGEIDRVVDYLAAMQLRRSSRVIEQFQTPEEIRQATELLERLRERGVYPLAENRPGNGQEDERT